MIVGFLADKIPYSASRGWGVYSRELLKVMPSIDPDIFYRCFYNFFRRGSKEHIITPGLPNMQNIVWRMPGRIMDMLWGAMGVMSADSVLGKIDILHVPYEFLPRVRSAKTVVTVHDVTFLAHPEHLDKSFVKLYTGRIQKIIRDADIIISDSESTRLELIQLAGAKENKIRVVPCAANERFRYISDEIVINKVRHHYGTGENYILFVGAADEDKNLLRFIQAFSKVRAEYHDLRFVMAGRKSWGYDRLMRRASEMGIDDGIVLAGFVDDADLPALYSGARLLVLPSVHEGFGLPVLEAMSCGTPVLCSDIPSLRELAGDIAVRVDPLNMGGMADGIIRLLEDRGFAQHCSSGGIERSKMFSWRKSAEKIISVYRELIN